MKKNAYTKFLFLSILLIGLCNTFNANAQQDLNDFPKDHEVKLVKERKRQLLLLPPGTNTVTISDLVPGELIYPRGARGCSPVQIGGVGRQIVESRG